MEMVRQDSYRPTQQMRKLRLEREKTFLYRGHIVRVTRQLIKALGLKPFFFFKLTSLCLSCPFPRVLSTSALSGQELLQTPSTTRLQNLSTALPTSSRGRRRADLMLSSTLKHLYNSVLEQSRLHPSQPQLSSSYAQGGRKGESVRAACDLQRLNPGPGGWHDKHPPNLGCLGGMGEGPTA